MKTFEFDQTSIPSQYSINLKDNTGIIWVDSRSADLYRTLFSAIADTLKIYQDKNLARIGMIMKDDKGNFKFGAVLNYTKPEEGSEEDSGNWYLEFTFYPEDMINLDREIDNHSDTFVRCAAQETQTICYGRFRNIGYMYSMFGIAIDTLISFLDTNASETEEVEVCLRGVFTASVAVEGGKKIMSIVPGECIKQIIKGDSVL
jgi:hypothetical protein